MLQQLMALVTDLQRSGFSMVRYDKCTYNAFLAGCVVGQVAVRMGELCYELDDCKRFEVRCIKAKAKRMSDVGLI